MKWYTTENGYKIAELDSNDVDLLVTPNGNYQWMNGDLVKVPDPGPDGVIIKDETSEED